MINEDLPSLSQATGDYKNSDEFERNTMSEDYSMR